MKNKTDLNEESLEEKVKIILDNDNDNDIRKWNEGVLIKSLILLPIIIFLIGLFFVNRPESLNQLIFAFLYTFILISIGVILLFIMRKNME